MKLNSLRYLKHIKTTGAITESSRGLIRNLTSDIDPRHPQVIVELGAGTGNVTAQILKKMHPSSVLYCFEIDEDFIADLEKISDKRFHLIKESATKLFEYIEPKSADVIISTLPLTLFRQEDRWQLIQDCNVAMKPGGVFRQFLYSFQRRYFSDAFNEITIRLALINFPPAIVYSCSNMQNPKPV